MLSLLLRLYLRLVTLPLALLLYIGGWKRSVIRHNSLLCRLNPPFLRLRICLHAALDFGSLAHGAYGRPIRLRLRDEQKLKKLKSGSSLFLSAHFHNWELMGGWLVRQGVPLLSAARSLAHPLSHSLLLRIRSRQGLETVSKDIPRRALRHLDQGGCFGLIWDQRVTRSPLQTPFFGYRLRVDPLPAFLLRHRSFSVWVGVLLPEGTFRLLLLSPSSSSSSIHPLTSARLARRYHRVLEILIRRNPTWWYGMAHRRFLETHFNSGSGVSRETSMAPEVIVSRETKLST